MLTVASTSLMAALINNTGSDTFWTDYLQGVAMNFPAALVARFGVAGPLTR